MDGTRQLSIFDLPAGRAAKEAGIALVEEHRAADCERVRGIILALVGQGRQITADDVWGEIDWECSPGVIGSCFNTLARQKRIVKTGAFTQSKRPNQHTATLFFWRAV